MQITDVSQSFRDTGQHGWFQYFAACRQTDRFPDILDGTDVEIGFRG